MAVDLAGWADYLLDAEARAQSVSPITDTESNLSVVHAYDISDVVLERRLRQGQKVVGAKIGLTSLVKQVAMGVSQPVYGWLTDAMLIQDGGVELSKLIHPRVEPEIVFVMGKELRGPAVTSADVLDAVRWVCCGFEIIDSRYESFRFKHADVVADNTSAALFMLGHLRIKASKLDLQTERCTLTSGGKTIATAIGADVMGDPAAAVAQLANHLAERGRSIEAGWIVLSGGLTDAVRLSAGTEVTASFDHLGTLTLQAVG